jgi:hypothetical protein
LARPGDDVITDFVVGVDKLQINALSSIVTDTAQGLLVSSTYVTLNWVDMSDSPHVNTTPGSVLLQGIHGNIGLGILMD